VHEGNYTDDAYEEDNGEQNELKKNCLGTTANSNEVIPLEHIPTPHTTGQQHADYKPDHRLVILRTAIPQIEAHTWLSA
jgi:hypothetical protein